MNGQTKHTKTTKKKTKVKVIHQNDQNRVSKNDVSLKNWWDFNYEGKYGISPSNRAYINDIGFDVLMNALNRGYSAKGLILSLALSAQESGYGNTKALANSYANNNFWGHKIPGTQINKKYNNKAEGEQAGMNLFETEDRYSRLRNLLRQDNPSLSGLDSGLHDYDPAEHPKYATYLHDSLIEGIAVRTLAMISEKLPDLQNEIEEKEAQMSKGIPLLPKPFISPFPMSDEDLLNQDSINKLKTEKNNLLHIKLELETGKSDTNYFLQPKTDELLKKGATMPYPANLGIPDWKTGGYSDTTEKEPPIPFLPNYPATPPHKDSRNGGAFFPNESLSETPRDSMPETGNIFSRGGSGNSSSPPGSVYSPGFFQTVPFGTGAADKPGMASPRRANLFDCPNGFSWEGPDAGSPAMETSSPGKVNNVSNMLQGHSGKNAGMVKSSPSDSIPSTSQINGSSASMGNQGGGKGAKTPVNNICHQPNYTINNLSDTSANKMYDQVVAVLTSAVADSKIGTDVH